MQRSAYPAGIQFRRDLYEIAGQRLKLLEVRQRLPSVVRPAHYGGFTLFNVASDEVMGEPISSLSEPLAASEERLKLEQGDSLAKPLARKFPDTVAQLTRTDERCGVQHLFNAEAALNGNYVAHPRSCVAAGRRTACNTLI